MARFVLHAGAGVATPARPYLFREETRRWYLRINRSVLADPVEVKVYDDLVAAAGNTSGYAASGTAAVVAGSTAPVLNVSLTDNPAVAPVFTGAKIDVALPSFTSTVIDVWEVDLGPQIERAMLRVFRALSVISEANGYFTTPVLIERGLRQWEEASSDGVSLRPYIGVSDITTEAEEWEIGSSSRKIQTTLIATVVAHLDVAQNGSGITDPNALPFYHDIRRSLRAIDSVAYDGAVNNGRIYDSLLFSISAEDGGIIWARDRASIEGTIRLVLQESGIDVA